MIKATTRPNVSAALTPARSVLLQRKKCACGGTAGPSGECEQCKKKKKLQRWAPNIHSVSSVPTIVHDVLRSPGRPLDAGTRGFMEPRFGYDFSQVRVHDNTRAAESARAVDAHAYTVGQDIVFDSGRYNPQSESGRVLLAHELAHTVQQRGIQRSTEGVGMPSNVEDQHFEREAEAAASWALRPKGSNLAVVASPISKAGRPILSRVAKKNPPVSVTTASAYMSTSHKVTADNEYVAGKKKVQSFTVDKLVVPATKGPRALAQYQSLASGNGLQATLDLSGTATKAALWQERAVTGDLRDRWLQRTGWPSGKDADDLWKKAGGDSEFPKVGGSTCQMDHIVELQIGGNNTNENIQPLDATQNSDSGGAIKQEVFQLAENIANESALSDGTADQVMLRFKTVSLKGTPEKMPAKANCPPLAGDAPGHLATPTCLSVECCAAFVKIPKGKGPAMAGEPYQLRAGGADTSVQVPSGFRQATKAQKAEIHGDPVNEAATELIPGFLLNTLHHGPTADTVTGQIDDRPKTRLPITVEDKRTDPVAFDVAKANGKLTLSSTKTAKGIKFSYPYLSAGEITELTYNETKGMEFAAWIKPSLPLFGKLDVQYKKGELILVKGLEEADLKKRSFLGMQITKAQVQLMLAPEFKPSGRVEMRVGSENAPLATASLDLSADSVGLIGKGKINVNIPKMKSAESDLTYKGGGGRDEWTGKIAIKSEDISLGSGISVTGGFKGQIEKGEVSFEGKVNATFPGNNTAELGLSRDVKQGWILSGGGTFHFPGLDDTTITATYNLEEDKLVATGKTGFELKALKLKGELTHVTFLLAKGQPLKVYGEGSLKFKRAKSEAELDVKLHPTGKFSGKGTLSYKLKENVTVTGTVELNEQEKLRITGELLVTRYEFFKKHGGNKDLFKLDMPVPVPGLSIGTTGLVFHIRGGVDVAYSFGPGALEPLKFSAGFDPLESDPDLELTVTGVVKIPASATLSAWISGSLAVQVDILVGSAGVEGGVKLQGDLILSAGAFANFDAAYKKKRLTAKLVAGIDTKLLLGLSLTAFARAWAGAFGITGEVRKDWVLANKTIDTRLGFYLSAPFEYADDTGVKLPELKDITLKEPEITTENLKRILGEIFGAAPEKRIEK